MLLPVSNSFFNTETVFACMRKLSSVAPSTEPNPNPPVFLPSFLHILITLLSDRPASLHGRGESAVADPAPN